MSCGAIRTMKEQNECENGDRNSAGPDRDTETTETIQSVTTGSSAAHRRNIREIIDLSKLDQETLNAQQAEFERLQRVQQQQKLAAIANQSLVTNGSLSDIDIDEANDDNNDDDDDVVLLSSDDEDINPALLRVKNKTANETVIVLSDSDCDCEETGTDGDSRGDVSIQDCGLHTDDALNVTDSEGRILVNVGHPVDDPDIFMAAQFVRAIKAHQIGGVRFLYDNIVENMTRLRSSDGLGCILAHAMGLGKTMQVICFTEIFMRFSKKRKIICIMPVNTLQNWMAEYDRWLPQRNSFNNRTAADTQTRDFQVFVMNDSCKTMQKKVQMIREWSDRGGVLLIGYELFRQLGLKKLAKSKTTNKRARVISLEDDEMADQLYGQLLNPGADLVICDEGHRIKNSNASTSRVLKEIRTRRRIALTGYPLQNNLLEYWCMVDFVRPNYLGSKSEFSNMFEQPIKNGQCIDSTPRDVQLMRQRVHVLYSLLKGFVQRRSHAVLKNALPQKNEHVLLVRLTPLQRQLYDRFMNDVVRSNTVANPIKAFTVCCKIWNHPDILYEYIRNRASNLHAANYQVSAADNFDLDDFVDENVTHPTAASSAQTSAFNSISYDWAYEIMRDYRAGQLDCSPKLRLFFTILDESCRLGDRVLLFTQSLSTLNLIEEFLRHRSISGTTTANSSGTTTTTTTTSNAKWKRDVNYFRLDGSTPALEREQLINDFNRNSRTKLFLVSTRAGCLGINLIGANRVIIFDASWNPCHDSQAVCRIYRYGQQKTCHIYRFVSDCCLEKKIYDRQVNKQGLSDRVLDERNPKANLLSYQVTSLCYDDGEESPVRSYRNLIGCYNDSVLDAVLCDCSELLTSEPFKHETMLETGSAAATQRLTRAEKNQAEQNYRREKEASKTGFVAPQSIRSTANRFGAASLPIASTTTVVSNTFQPFSPSADFWINRNVRTLEMILYIDVPVIANEGRIELIPAGTRVLFLNSENGSYLQLENGRVLPIPSYFKMMPNDFSNVTRSQTTTGAARSLPTATVTTNQNRWPHTQTNQQHQHRPTQHQPTVYEIIDD